MLRLQAQVRRTDDYAAGRDVTVDSSHDGHLFCVRAVQSANEKRRASKRAKLA